MNRRTARAIHQMTNMSYWMENPNWDAGSGAFNLLCSGMQALPFSVHTAQKKFFFKRPVIVSGESVVTSRDMHRVDKFMFRYPGTVALEAFRGMVEGEIEIVARKLGRIAISTAISIRGADIFRHSRKPVPAVTQTQERLSEFNTAFDLDALVREPSRAQDQTLRDLEQLVTGSQSMIAECGLYPDITPVSGNVRRNSLYGYLKLIDVMPFYADGSRLIGDHPPDAIPRLEASLQTYADFVGQYGG